MLGKPVRTTLLLLREATALWDTGHNIGTVQIRLGVNNHSSLSPKGWGGCAGQNDVAYYVAGRECQSALDGAFDQSGRDARRNSVSAQFLEAQGSFHDGQIADASPPPEPLLAERVAIYRLQICYCDALIAQTQENSAVQARMLQQQHDAAHRS